MNQKEGETRMYPFRLFISFAHEDEPFALKIIETLRNMGLRPWWSERLRAGSLFIEEIQKRITYAHVFMPLITANSQNRPWVHQEIGYAIARNVPVAPVCIGKVAHEMLEPFQSILVEHDLSNLEERLRRANMDQVVISKANVDQSSLVLPPRSIDQVVEWPGDRTRCISYYANYAFDLSKEDDQQFNDPNVPKTKHRILRQRAALSSFDIPDEEPGHPVWAAYEGNRERPKEHRELLRNERQTLEFYAKEYCCRLIIAPEIDLSDRGPEVMITRLSILRKFLDTMACQVEVVTVKPGRRNVTIVGDWFMAESQLPTPEGYRQTMFSWHAPTVFAKAREFDKEFKRICDERQQTAEEARNAAKEKIDELIKRAGGRI